MQGIALAQGALMVEERASFRDRVGMLVDSRWRVDSLLGEGGMARVYRATHTNGREVAIKFLRDEVQRHGGAVERFLDEGFAANRVGHPGVVAVYDDGVDDLGCPYLVMEMLVGESLDSLRGRQGGTLSETRALELGRELCEILVAAHSQGILHRDIKPDNVFLTEAGRVKLLDFGIARVRDTRRSNQTEAGVALGTPEFMAPEQARGRRADVRSDVFGVGATLYCLLSGRAVHEGETLQEVLLSAMTRPVVALEERISVAPAVCALVNRAVAFDAEDRYQTMRDLQTAIERAMRGESPSTLTPLAVDDAPPQAPDSATRSEESQIGGTRPTLLAYTAWFGALAAAGFGLTLCLAWVSARFAEAPAATVRSGRTDAYVPPAVPSLEPSSPVVERKEPPPPPESPPGVGAAASRDAPTPSESFPASAPQKPKFQSPSTSAPEQWGQRGAKAAQPAASMRPDGASPAMEPGAEDFDPLRQRR